MPRAPCSVFWLEFYHRMGLDSIDGQMRRIDEQTYMKYFSVRRKNSRWSEKNKMLAQTLEAQGLMTEFGREQIERAKENGQWDAPPKTLRAALKDSRVSMVGISFGV